MIIRRYTKKPIINNNYVFYAPYNIWTEINKIKSNQKGDFFERTAAGGFQKLTN